MKKVIQNERVVEAWNLGDQYWLLTLSCGHQLQVKVLKRERMPNGIYKCGLCHKPKNRTNIYPDNGETE